MSDLTLTLTREQWGYILLALNDYFGRDSDPEANPRESEGERAFDLIEKALIETP